MCDDDCNANYATPAYIALSRKSFASERMDHYNNSKGSRCRRCVCDGMRGAILHSNVEKL